MRAVNNSKVYDLTIIAAFAALIIVLGGIAIPVGGLGVPVVLQNMGIALAGMILGFKRGGLATTLFLAVGLVGVPNMAGWKPLLAAFPGPTVGYIVGYLIAGFTIGAIAQQAPRAKVSRISVFIGAGLVGVLLQYFFGSVGLAWRMGLSFTDALITNVPFIPGDVAKVVVAALIATAVLQAFPDLLPDAANRKQRRLVKEAATSGN
ncbi:biotin transporter BioY [Corynebacterium sp. 5QC2CO]|uniref:biotin transporter BioY n=1 Tax=Corynebacterium sp. 5QC2CO TaxID=2968468 RepID=UPI00211CF72D|nr:biotin transporter BioY [Corynebacterium sp. 5QC2CO]MCQ9350013.1 biotin transporter BioY [Corynebacterium sp. 5QC2CO]